MSEKRNIMAQPSTWDLVASGYAETTMQMLALYAEVAIEKLNLHQGARVLDVACGPGTVSLMIAGQVQSVHSIDFSASMLEVFEQNVCAKNFDNIYVHHDDAQCLPYENEQFDAAISMFGLMFFPDRMAGFSEIYRTLKKGGRIMVSSWAPVADSPAMQAMFGALQQIHSDLPEPKTALESLENPHVFQAELEAAGFKDVCIERVTKSFPIESIAEFWQGMIKGSAPMTMMKHKMNAQLWAEKEQLALAFLKKRIPQTPTVLAADAWLGAGIK